MPDKIGHYTIVSELGRGGMGVVLKGREETLNRFVAIKVLGEHLTSEPEFLSRFVREARAAAALSHPNIIQIYFIGEDNGKHYFAMEYVNGRSVSSLIKNEGRVGNPRAAQVILQAAHGLAAAHDQGIYHRDIKPANLMLDERGMLKIADFGLALPVEAQTRLTASGRIMGTPGYLSPEHCLGQPVDHRADIYALGITYYEMLTGSMPFNGDSPIALLRAILQDEPPDVQKLNPDVDEESRRILMKMLAKDREKDRYQDCHALAADLEEFLGQRGVRNLTTGLATRAPGRPSKATAADTPTTFMGGGDAPTTPTDAPTAHQAKSTQPDVALTMMQAQKTQPSVVPPTPAAMPVASRSSASSLWIAAIVFLLIAGGGSGAWFGYKALTGRKNAAPQTTQASVLPTSVQQPATEAPPGRSPLAVEQASPQTLLSSPNNVPANVQPEKSLVAEPPVKTQKEQQQAGVQTQRERGPMTTPPIERPARKLSGVAFAVVGDPNLNPHVANVLQQEIEAAGLQATNAEDLGEGDDPSRLISRLRAEGVATLIVARIKPTGQRELHYMGRYDTAYASNISLTTYDVATGRTIGSRASGNIEYTSLSAEREAEKVVGKLARKATEAIQGQ